MVAFGSSGALRLASFRVLSGLAPSRALRPAPSRALAPSRVLVSCAFLRFASCGPCADVVCVPAPASCVFLRLAPLLCLAAPTSCAFPRSAPSRVLRVPAPCAFPRLARSRAPRLPASCAFPRLAPLRLARSRGRAGASRSAPRVLRVPAPWPCASGLRPLVRLGILRGLRCLGLPPVGVLRASGMGAIPSAVDPGKPSRSSPGPPAFGVLLRSAGRGGPGDDLHPGGWVDGGRDGLGLDWWEV